MVEDGGDIPTVLSAADKKLVEAEFEKAARALGIDWGPAKGDMIFGEDGKPYVIEIAARLSGGNFCYDKVPWSTGVDIVDILVDMAVGNTVDPARFAPDARPGHLAALFLPRRRHDPADRRACGGARRAAYPQGGCLGPARRDDRGAGKPSLPGRLCDFLRADAPGSGGAARRQVAPGELQRRSSWWRLNGQVHRRSLKQSCPGPRAARWPLSMRPRRAASMPSNSSFSASPSCSRRKSWPRARSTASAWPGNCRWSIWSRLPGGAGKGASNFPARLSIWRR